MTRKQKTSVQSEKIILKVPHTSCRSATSSEMRMSVLCISDFHFLAASTVKTSLWQINYIKIRQQKNVQSCEKNVVTLSKDKLWSQVSEQHSHQSEMLTFLQNTNTLNLYISYISWQHFRHLSRIRFRLHLYELTFISGDVSTIVTHRMLFKWTYSSHVCGNTAGYFRPDYRTCNRLVSSKKTRYYWWDVRKICSWKLDMSRHFQPVYGNNIGCFWQDISTICSRKQDMFDEMSRHFPDVFGNRIRYFWPDNLKTKNRSWDFFQAGQ